MRSNNSNEQKKKAEAKPRGFLQKPSFKLKEESLLVEQENLFTSLWRGFRIFYEYMHGFYVFRKVERCVTIFGSARFKEDHRYYQMARDMGSLLAKANFTVMTGGGPGIMEAANRGAKEAGGLSIGCSIELLPKMREKPNAYMDKKITMHFFFVRKMMLTKYSSAFVVMPGGFGTFDELFEMTTLIQVGRIKHFPLILMGTEYWRPLMEYLQGTLIPQGTILAEDISQWLMTDSPTQALKFLQETLSQPK